MLLNTVYLPVARFLVSLTRVYPRNYIFYTILCFSVSSLKKVYSNTQVEKYGIVKTQTKIQFRFRAER